MVRMSESKGDLPAGLGKPALRALAAAGYTRLEQFTGVSEAEILRLHGMGPNALDRIRRALAARGLSFTAGLRGAPDVDSGRPRTT
jgi:sugar phosphate isomerase/epimerase